MAILATIGVVLGGLILEHRSDHFRARADEAECARLRRASLRAAARPWEPGPAEPGATEPPSAN